MAKKKKLDALDTTWQQKPTPDNEWPGTPQEFLGFLGVSRKKLLATHYAEYDDLTGLRDREIVSLSGGIKYPGTVKQKYVWTYQCKKSGDCWIAGERVQASAVTRQEAALRALLVLWELITRRQQQGSLA